MGDSHEISNKPQVIVDLKIPPDVKMFITDPWEDLFSVLQEQDLTYLPPEVRGWMDAMHMLSRSCKNQLMWCFTQNVKPVFKWQFDDR